MQTYGLFASLTASRQVLANHDLLRARVSHLRQVFPDLTVAPFSKKPDEVRTRSLGHRPTIDPVFFRSSVSTSTSTGTAKSTSPQTARFELSARLEAPRSRVTPSTTSPTRSACPRISSAPGGCARAASSPCPRRCAAARVAGPTTAGGRARRRTGRCTRPRGAAWRLLARVYCIKNAFFLDEIPEERWVDESDRVVE